MKSPAGTKLQLTVSAETGRAFVPFLRAQLPRAHRMAPRLHRLRLRGCGEPPADASSTLRRMSLILINDRQMSALHQRFMDIAGPTDVLSFSVDQDAGGHTVSGEVYVCVPQAIREARSRKIPPRLELLLYCIHGMLHLAGYDDRTDRDFQRMHSMEDAILTKLGFGPIFAGKNPEAGAR